MPRVDSISDEVFVVLRRIIRVIEVSSRRLAQQYGLTGTQLLILQELLRTGEIGVGELAKNISLSSGTVTDILDRMEKRDLVKRTRNTHDKRRVQVKITEKGKGILNQTPAMLQNQFKKEFDKLKDWEKSLLLSSLQRIADMMENKTTDIKF